MEYKSYFDYVISLNKLPDIQSVCQVVSSKNELVEMSKERFCGLMGITADWRLFKVVKVCLQNNEILDSSIMNRDAITVYKRCQALFLADHDINYDEFFDGLVELNWLFASSYNCEMNKSSRIVLLSSYSDITENLKSFLLNLYNLSVNDHNEYVYIDEALKARKTWFPGIRYKFKYDESRKYLNSERYYTKDMDNLWEYYKDEGAFKRSLFFGLTATAALADYIRRYA